MTKAPQLGLTARAELLRIVDGDTVDLEVRLPVRVRLLDCWAPERHTIEGQMSGDFLGGLLSKSDDLRVFIPTQDASSLKDVMTFGRVLGQVWLEQESALSVSEIMVSAGHATKEKE